MKLEETKLLPRLGDIILVAMKPRIPLEVLYITDGHRDVITRAPNGMTSKKIGKTNVMEVYWDDQEGWLAKE